MASILVGGLITSGAHAQFYVGGGIGQAHVSIPSLSTTISGVPVTASAGKTSDTSYKLYGGYQFTPNWGIEMGYNDLGNKYSGKITVAGLSATTPAKADNWYVAATGTLPLGNGFSLLGKLGVVRNHTASGTTCVAGNCVSGSSDNRSQLLAGIGAQYSFTSNLAARLEYEDYGRASSDDVWGTGTSGAARANSWSLSLKYAF